MNFPIFLFIVLAVAVLLIILIAAYLRFYKRNNHKALDKNAHSHTSITAPNKVEQVLIITILIVAILISYFAGYKTAYDTFEESLSHSSTFDIQTFYAEVKEIDGNTLFVEGIPLNDENYRGDLQYDVLDEIKVEWHNSPINLSDLDKGDLISITLVVDRTGITDVFKIQLLDDVK